MASTTLTTGFYGTDTDTYYVTPGGRVWQIQSEDDLGTQDPVEVTADRLADARRVDFLPEEAVDHLRRIEKVGGETLIEE